MNGIWAVLVLAAVIIILASSIKIRIIYYIENKANGLTITLSALFGLITLKGKYNLMQLVSSQKQNVPKEFSETGSMLESFQKFRLTKGKYNNSIRYLRNRIAINKLEWNTVLGTGDAAVTGITIGLLWNVKAIISFVLSSMFSFKNIPDINIIPCFDGAVFSTRIDCILSLKIGHAIIAGVTFLIDKQRDGDTFERASDRGLDENHYGKHKGNG